MADISQVLATGGTALVSAAAGAGLTYWLGALNRRHQEAREDATRWYEARFKAYAELPERSAIAFERLGGTRTIWKSERTPFRKFRGPWERYVSLARRKLLPLWKWSWTYSSTRYRASNALTPR